MNTIELNIGAAKDVNEGHARKKYPAHRVSSTLRHEKREDPVRDRFASEIMEMLRAPNLMDMIASDIGNLGYAGEDHLKKMIYLCATSRRLLDPFSLRIVSPAGSGKSALADVVTCLIPPDEVRVFSGLTAKALYYSAGNDPGDLAHTFVVVAEAEGRRQADYPLRTLLSEKNLVLQTVTAGGTCLKKEVHGPIAYIETSTKEHINPETESRLFRLRLDVSPAQTRLAHHSIARKYTVVQDRDPAIIAKHYALQTYLQKNARITIPFADRIGFPAHSQLARREFAKFLSVIAASAYLHQYQRTSYDDGSRTIIEASRLDYELALDLTENAIRESLALSMPGQSGAVLAAAREVHTRKLGSGLTSMTRSEIKDVAMLTDRPLDYGIRHLLEMGLLERIEGSRGRKCLYTYDTTKDESSIILQD